MGLIDFFKDLAGKGINSLTSGPEDAFNKNRPPTTGYSDAVADTVGFIQEQGLPGFNDLKGLLDEGLGAVKDALSNISAEDGVNAAFALVDLALARGEPATTVEALRQEAKRLQNIRDRAAFDMAFCESLERLPNQEFQPVNKRCRDLGFEVGPELDKVSGLPLEGPHAAGNQPGSKSNLVLLGLAGVVGFLAIKG